MDRWIDDQWAPSDRRGHCSNVPLQANTACLYLLKPDFSEPCPRLWLRRRRSRCASSLPRGTSATAAAAVVAATTLCSSISLSFSFFCSQFVSNTNISKLSKHRLRGRSSFDHLMLTGCSLQPPF